MSQKVQPNYSANLMCSMLLQGSEPLHCRFKDGQKITGANAKDLTFSALIPSDHGAYEVSVSNEAGAKRSSPVQIVVHEPITVTQQPTDARVIEGGGAVFEVKSIGTKPIQYEWRFNGKAIEGASI